MFSLILYVFEGGSNRVITLPVHTVCPMHIHTHNSSQLVEIAIFINLFKKTEQYF